MGKGRSNFNNIEKSTIKGFNCFLSRFNNDVEDHTERFLLKAWKIYQREHELKVLNHSNYKDWLRWAIDNTVEAIELYPHYIDYIFEGSVFDYDSLIRSRLKAIVK